MTNTSMLSIYLVTASVLLTVMKYRQMVKCLPHFLITLSVLRGCFFFFFSWFNQFLWFQSPCFVIPSTFSFQNLLRLLLLFAAPMSDQILKTGCLFCWLLCCSFLSSFHIFGCDPTGPSDSLLLNAAAHQSTPGSGSSSSPLPGMSESRRGASQTSPVLYKLINT